MDVNIPGLNGLQVTRRLQHEQVPCRVLMLTAYDDAEQIFQAVRAGACGYFPKDIVPHTLIEAIHHVSRGAYVVENMVMDAAQLAAWLFHATERFGNDGIAEESAAILSLREMEILQCIARGMSNKATAHQLGISHQTVKNHMTTILRKMGVADRTQAVIYALQRGWVRLQEIPAVAAPAGGGASYAKEKMGGMNYA
jgi:DNA-binding NarL/FixJ family response regulator